MPMPGPPAKPAGGRGGNMPIGPLGGGPFIPPAGPLGPPVSAAFFAADIAAHHARVGHTHITRKNERDASVRQAELLHPARCRSGGRSDNGGRHE